MVEEDEVVEDRQWSLQHVNAWWYLLLLSWGLPRVGETPPQRQDVCVEVEGEMGEG